MSDKNPIKDLDDIQAFAEIMKTDEFQNIANKHKGFEEIFTAGVSSMYAEELLHQAYEANEIDELMIKSDSISNFLAIPRFICLETAAKTEIFWMMRCIRNTQKEEQRRRRYGWLLDLPAKYRTTKMFLMSYFKNSG